MTSSKSRKRDYLIKCEVKSKMRKGLTYAIVGIVMVMAIAAIITGCTANQAGQAAGGGGTKCPTISAEPCKDMRVGEQCGFRSGSVNLPDGVCTMIWINNKGIKQCECASKPAS
jgi:hypothetical protein